MATVDTAKFIFDAETGTYVADVNKASKATKNLDNQTQLTSKSIIGYTAAITGAVYAVGRLSDAVLQMEADQARINAAYGDGTDELEKYAETVTKATGTVKQDFEKTAAAMSVTAENMGFTTEAANQYGIAVAQLTTVTAAYLNMPMEETAMRVTSAMRGEAESAEILGLSLSDTAMNAFVEAQKKAGVEIDKTWKEMSDQEKMYLRLDAAINQTANTMGVEIPLIKDSKSAQEALNVITDEAAANTSNYAIVLAGLKNGFNDFLEAMIPVMEAFFGYLILVYKNIKANWIFYEAVIAVTAVIIIMRASLIQLAIANFLATWQIWLIIAAIIAVIYAYNKWEKVQMVIDTIIKVFIATLQVLALALFGVYHIIQDFLVPVLKFLGKVIWELLHPFELWRDIMTICINKAKELANALQPQLTTAINAIMHPLETIINLFERLWQIIVDVTDAILGGLIGAFNSIPFVPNVSTNSAQLNGNANGGYGNYNSVNKSNTNNINYNISYKKAPTLKQLRSEQRFSQLHPGVI